MTLTCSNCGQTMEFSAPAYLAAPSFFTLFKQHGHSHAPNVAVIECECGADFRIGPHTGIGPDQAADEFWEFLLAHCGCQNREKKKYDDA